CQLPRPSADAVAPLPRVRDHRPGVRHVHGPFPLGRPARRARGVLRRAGRRELAGLVVGRRVRRHRGRRGARLVAARLRRPTHLHSAPCRRAEGAAHAGGGSGRGKRGRGGRAAAAQPGPHHRCAGGNRRRRDGGTRMAAGAADTAGSVWAVWAVWPAWRVWPGGRSCRAPDADPAYPRGTPGTFSWWSTVTEPIDATKAWIALVAIG